MKEKVLRFQRNWKVIVSLFLFICLIFAVPLSAYGSGDAVITEVRQLLEENYVDPVPEEVLNAPTVEEMLTRLGDKYTEYLTHEEYEDFINAIDNSFSGIGITLKIEDEGVLVTGVFDGYGASRAGILEGDLIVKADGVSLDGKSEEFCLNKLLGPAGSSVEVEVQRGEELLTFHPERMLITLPLVQSTVLDNHIGYIAIYSFGEDLIEQFKTQILDLKSKGADCLIIDLRDNTGGYSQAALDLLGFFTGAKTAVIVKDKSTPSLVLKATKQEFILNLPAILLTNGMTASSSEIFTGALKDYNTATIVGETTYGSGRFKGLFPLSNGDALKMSVSRFYSPYNHKIDEVGIAPHIKMAGADEFTAAYLLFINKNAEVSGDTQADKSGYLKVTAGPNSFYLSLEDIRKAENWAAGKEILDALLPSGLQIGTYTGWRSSSADFLKERIDLYYPGYYKVPELTGISLNKTFTVTFRKDMDWNTVNAGKVELIEAATGQRAECVLTPGNSRVMTVKPYLPLKPNTEYWLLFHPGMKDSFGNTLPGSDALVKTGN